MQNRQTNEPLMQHDTRHDQSIRLPDGRRLGYAEYGDPNGKPVFLFHGLPGSRLQRPPDDSIAIGLGARIIAVDRPGFGLSDFLPWRTLADWPRDVVVLADTLGIGRFAVAGISAGGPYALACAERLPKRVTVAAIASSPSPTYLPGVLHGMIWQNRVVIEVALRTPPKLASGVARVVDRLTGRDPQRTLQLVFGAVSAPLTTDDEQVLAQPEIQEMYRASVAEAYRNGWGGHAWELIVLNRPWGLRLDTIKLPVYLWHGEADTLVPPQMGRYLAQALPNCHPTYIAGAGHLLVFHHWRAMLEQLLS